MPPKNVKHNLNSSNKHVSNFFSRVHKYAADHSRVYRIDNSKEFLLHLAKKPLMLKSFIEKSPKSKRREILERVIELWKEEGIELDNRVIKALRSEFKELESKGKSPTQEKTTQKQKSKATTKTKERTQVQETSTSKSSSKTGRSEKVETKVPKEFEEKQKAKRPKTNSKLRISQIKLIKNFIESVGIDENKAYRQILEVEKKMEKNEKNYINLERSLLMHIHKYTKKIIKNLNYTFKYNRDNANKNNILTKEVEREIYTYPAKELNEITDKIGKNALSIRDFERFEERQERFIANTSIVTENKFVAPLQAKKSLLSEPYYNKIFIKARDLIAEGKEDDAIKTIENAKTKTERKEEINKDNSRINRELYHELANELVQVAQKNNPKEVERYLKGVQKELDFKNGKPQDISKALITLETELNKQIIKSGKTDIIRRAKELIKGLFQKAEKVKGDPYRDMFEKNEPINADLRDIPEVRDKTLTDEDAPNLREEPKKIRLINKIKASQRKEIFNEIRTQEYYASLLKSISTQKLILESPKLYKRVEEGKIDIEELKKNTDTIKGTFANEILSMNPEVATNFFIDLGLDIDRAQIIHQFVKESSSQDIESIKTIIDESIKHINPKKEFNRLDKEKQLEIVKDAFSRKIISNLPKNLGKSINESDLETITNIRLREEIIKITDNKDVAKKSAKMIPDPEIANLLNSNNLKHRKIISKEFLSRFNKYTTLSKMEDLRKAKSRLDKTINFLKNEKLKLELTKLLEEIKDKIRGKILSAIVKEPKRILEISSNKKRADTLIKLLTKSEFRKEALRAYELVDDKIKGEVVRHFKTIGKEDIIPDLVSRIDDKDVRAVEMGKIKKREYSNPKIRKEYLSLAKELTDLVENYENNPEDKLQQIQRKLDSVNEKDKIKILENEIKKIKSPSKGIIRSLLRGNRKSKRTIYIERSNKLVDLVLNKIPETKQETYLEEIQKKIENEKIDRKLEILDGEIKELEKKEIKGDKDILKIIESDETIRQFLNDKGIRRSFHKPIIETLNSIKEKFQGNEKTRITREYIEQVEEYTNDKFENKSIKDRAELQVKFSDINEKYQEMTKKEKVTDEDPIQEALDEFDTLDLETEPDLETLTDTNLETPIDLEQLEKEIIENSNPSRDIIRRFLDYKDVREEFRYRITKTLELIKTKLRKTKARELTTNFLKRIEKFTESAYKGQKITKRRELNEEINHILRDTRLEANGLKSKEYYGEAKKRSKGQYAKSQTRKTRDERIKYLKLALKENKYNDDARVELIREYTYEGNFEKAIDSLYITNENVELMKTELKNIRKSIRDKIKRQGLDIKVKDSDDPADLKRIVKKIEVKAKSNNSQKITIEPKREEKKKKTELKIDDKKVNNLVKDIKKETLKFENDKQRELNAFMFFPSKRDKINLEGEIAAIVSLPFRILESVEQNEGWSKKTWIKNILKILKDKGIDKKYYEPMGNKKYEQIFEEAYDYLFFEGSNEKEISRLIKDYPNNPFLYLLYQPSKIEDKIKIYEKAIEQFKDNDLLSFMFKRNLYFKTKFNREKLLELRRIVNDFQITDYESYLKLKEEVPKNFEGTIIYDTLGI